MINHLEGKLVEKAAPYLVIDVSGIGYELQASLATFTMLPLPGEAVKLLTHFVVREDAQLLFGFATAGERKLFRALIKVNGVGPKLALAILSGMDGQHFARCINGNDVKSLTQLPGVGKKTAERLIIEMKDHIKEWQESAELASDDASAARKGSSKNTIIAEAESALVALGYKPIEASKAVAKVDMANVESSEQAIRAALQAMINR